MTSYVIHLKSLQFGELQNYVVTETEVLNYAGKIALDMVVRWGLTACDTPGIEDSAGRAKLMLMSTDQVVQRACDLTSEMLSECKRRGWVLQFPLPEGEIIYGEQK